MFLLYKKSYVVIHNALVLLIPTDSLQENIHISISLYFSYRLIWKKFIHKINFQNQVNSCIKPKATKDKVN